MAVMRLLLLPTAALCLTIDPDTSREADELMRELANQGALEKTISRARALVRNAEKAAVPPPSQLGQVPPKAAAVPAKASADGRAADEQNGEPKRPTTWQTKKKLEQIRRRQQHRKAPAHGGPGRPAVPARPKVTSGLVTKKDAVCNGRGNVTDEEFLQQCPACRLSGVGVARLYVIEAKDGLGSRVHDVLAGMALAARTGLALGGVTFGKHTCQESHGVDIMKSAGIFFGLKNTRLMFTNHPPQYTQTWPGVSSFERGLEKYGMPYPKENIFIANHCLACDLDQNAHDMSSYFTPQLLAQLREGTSLKHEPLTYRKDATWVAIHVRRGDVDATDLRRGTSDKFYFSLIDQLKRLVPDPDIHVFSSLEGRRDSAEFDPYRRRNITVHLDGDVLEPWAHFVMADVMVTAKSSFSHVGAILNSNCVVYQPYWHRPLDDWVHAQANDEEPLSQDGMEALANCLIRKRMRYLKA